MSSRRRDTLGKLMSEELKWQLAPKLGVRPTVEQGGWGAVSARDCGRLVHAAIEVAEEEMLRQAPPRRI